MVGLGLFQPLSVCPSIPIRGYYGLWLSVWSLVYFIISFINTRSKLASILPHACLGGYVWLESHLSLGKLELLVKQLPSFKRGEFPLLLDVS